MKEAVALNRYAEALYGAALKRNEVLPVEKDLEGLAGVFDSTALGRVLMDPQFSREKKESVITRIASQFASPLTGSLLRLLLRKNRLSMVVELSKTYRLLSEDHRGIIEADVALAHEPKPSLKQKIEKYLASVTGKQIIVHYLVEPKLVGGILVHMKNFMLDATVRTKLDEMNRRLLELRLS